MIFFTWSDLRANINVQVQTASGTFCSHHLTTSMRFFTLIPALLRYWLNCQEVKSSWDIKLEDIYTLNPSFQVGESTGSSPAWDSQVIVSQEHSFEIFPSGRQRASFLCSLLVGSFGLPPLLVMCTSPIQQFASLKPAIEDITARKAAVMFYRQVIALT